MVLTRTIVDNNNKDPSYQDSYPRLENHLMKIHGSLLCAWETGRNVTGCLIYFSLSLLGEAVGDYAGGMAVGLNCCDR